ncbi:ATP-binding cassette domain-containing protein [Candidatus Rariloculus sp.]|uniref:ATP-binding cassette domain-containing protein n=1 Tax=Candidatus Rariloculus sp. TaxID=3101265 RepID=UPI003D0A7444
MNTRTPLLSLDNVDVKIAGTTVLHGLSWQLVEGAHWGIVGPNGSGKSSFLGLIAGTLWPAPGAGRRRYGFDGRLQRDAVEARRRIALVGPELQDRYAKWGWNFSALDVVLSGVFRQDVPRKRAEPAERVRARAMMRDFGLIALGERPFLELSRGEQRRVLIARSMAFRPSILLLDEPAGGLDRHSRAVLDELIGRVGEDTTVVSSGHTVDDLPLITTGVLRLEDGRVVNSLRYRAAAPAGRGPRSRADAAPSRKERPGSSRRERSGSSGRADGLTLAAGGGEDRSRRQGEPLIEVDHADVWLGQRRVLHDICWRLEDGEHWLVRGANGAGKSSFLKLIHGQLRPSLGGSVRWPRLGDPRSVWDVRRQIGYVSAELQAAYRYPSTVHDCVASGFASSIGLTRRLTAAEAQRTARLLDGFALREHAARPLSSLSYGQLRRVLLARMLVNAPRIVLLDEPFEGLDDLSHDIVRAELRGLVADGTQLICASHRADIRTRFTHELVIEGGRITAAGPRAGSSDQL